MSSAGIDIKSSCAEMVDEMKRSIDILLHRAVEAGSVRTRRLDRRDDRPGRRASAKPEATPATTTPRCSAWCQIVCDGLRPPAALKRASHGAGLPGAGGLR